MHAMKLSVFRPISLLSLRNMSAHVLTSYFEFSSLCRHSVDRDNDADFRLVHKITKSCY